MLMFFLANLDTAMMNFLKQYFPAEVKQKNLENQKTLTINQTTEDLERCEVM